MPTKQRTKLKRTSLALGPEWDLCARLAPKTVLRNKTALLRQCLEDNLTETAQRYLKKGETL